MNIYFPYDLTIVPGLILITIAIVEIRSKRKTDETDDDDKGILVMPGLFLLMLLGIAYMYFFVKSEEDKESITDIVRWFSFICSLFFLVLYIRKRRKQVKSP